MARKANAARPAPNQLDPLIHERLRLGILSALVVQESLTFTELRNLLRTTDGNLSVQARRLEEAGYIVCTKRFVGRKPKSTYRLSAAGRRALEEYLETLSGMLPGVEAVRGTRAAGPLRGAAHPLPSPS
jgi:DNA-binding PadR family transcriptional regulator